MCKMCHITHHIECYMCNVARKQHWRLDYGTRLDTLRDTPMLSSTFGTSSACMAAGACANGRANSSFLAVADAITAAMVVASCRTSYCFHGVASWPSSSVGCALAVSSSSPAAVGCGEGPVGTHSKSPMLSSFSTPPVLWTAESLHAVSKMLCQPMYYNAQEVEYN